MAFVTAAAQEKPRAERNRHLTLWIAKIGLATFVLGMVLTDRSAILWPIQTWPMYSQSVFDAPGDETAQRYLVVHTADGARHRVEISRIETELFPSGRYVVTERIVDCALTGKGPAAERCAAYLSLQVGLHLDLSAPARIELRETRWAVDAAAWPPLDYAAPIADVSRGFLNASPEARP